MSILAQDYTPKILNAKRIEQSPDIDGDLSDDEWQSAPIATDFVEFTPVPDTPSSQKTEVRILYDDEALYVGAYLYDTAPDSILKQLTTRDGLDNADFFSIAVSCYQDGQNGFEFGVTPAGVQRDTRLGIYEEDASWNAVWQCNVKITDEGWIAEYKIPFSALRFPDEPVQTWDINFYRSIRRTREQSLWTPKNPAIDGFVNQMGVLEGIEGIKPPVRLAFFPYLTGYYDRFPTRDGSITGGFNYAGGLDIKYGISDAFTLDATVIPDFGQVVFDPEVLNLSPFEVFFDENRQFFTEGTELFQKGDLFYSRRIGGRPVNLDRLNTIAETDSVLSYNSTVQLLNASKVSGRTKSGLGIGVLNSVTASEVATVSRLGEENYELEIAPLSNFNVLVLDQNLKNNSSVALINTSVIRNGSTYDANVTAIDISLLNKDNSAGLFGGAAVSQFFGEDISEKPGARYSLFYDKSGGKFNYGAGFETMDNRFDNNDLGFNANNNTFTAEGYVRWNEYEPFWKLNNARAALSYEYKRINNPSDFTEFLVDFEFLGNTKSFHTFGGGTTYSHFGFKDYFEPRQEGRYFNWPRKQDATLWISSDYRRKIALDARWWSTFTDIPGFYSFNYRIAPRIRVSDKIMLRYVYSRQNFYNQPGYAGGNRLEEYPEEIDDQILFGRRDRVTHTNVLFVDYIMTNRMGFSANLRHYWSNVKYKEFYQLTEDGGLAPTVYDSFREDGTTLNDNSFNALTLDAIFRWVFSPGSELSAVYKIALIDSEDIVPNTFTDNLDRTLNLPQSTSFSIRVSYFLDWLDIKNKGQRIKN
ncbi:MAG: DUF5916 domain-containing protein [Flavobacteriales bacterium]